MHLYEADECLGLKNKSRHQWCVRLKEESIKLVISRAFSTSIASVVICHM